MTEQRGLRRRNSLEQGFRTGACARGWTAGVVASLLSLGIGCGSSSSYELAPVRGTVTIGGVPLTEGKVMFAPIAKGDDHRAGKPAFGFLGSDGSFVLGTYADEDGAVVGDHWVTVIRYRDADKPGQAASPAIPVFSRVLAPERVTVAAGKENKIDIALTTPYVAKHGERP